MIILTVGSFDHADPVAQMQAIDLILCHYFQTWDWIRARAEARQKRRATESTR